MLTTTPGVLTSCSGQVRSANR